MARLIGMGVVWQEKWVSSSLGRGLALREVGWEDSEVVLRVVGQG